MYSLNCMKFYKFHEILKMFKISKSEKKFLTTTTKQFLGPLSTSERSKTYCLTIISRNQNISCKSSITTSKKFWSDCDCCSLIWIHPLTWQIKIRSKFSWGKILVHLYRVSRQLVLTFDFNSWLSWWSYEKS